MRVSAACHAAGEYYHCRVPGSTRVSCYHHTAKPPEGSTLTRKQTMLDDALEGDSQ